MGAERGRVQVWTEGYRAGVEAERARLAEKVRRVARDEKSGQVAAALIRVLRLIEDPADADKPTPEQQAYDDYLDGRADHS